MSKKKAFVPNAEASAAASEKAGKSREGVFLNVKDLPVGKQVYFRALPPHANVIKAWGNIITLPQIRWFFKNGDKWLNSTSEESLGPDKRDSVVDFLKAQKLDREAGFSEAGGKMAPRVRAWRNTFASPYKKADEVFPLEPNDKGTFLIAVVQVEKQLDEDGCSVPVGAPKLLSVNWSVNKELAREDMGNDPSFWDTGEGGFDFYILVDEQKKGSKTQRKYSLGIRRGASTALLDGEELEEQVPDAIAELKRGLRQDEVIKYFADVLEYDLDDDGSEEGDEEEEEEEAPARKPKAKSKPEPQEEDESGDEDETPTKKDKKPVKDFDAEKAADKAKTPPRRRVNLGDDE